MPDSIEKCNIELEPTEWEITEVSVLPPLDFTTYKFSATKNYAYNEPRFNWHLYYFLKDLSQPVDDGLHLENNKYLKTRTSFFNPKTYFSFNIHNVTIGMNSLTEYLKKMVIQI